MAPKEKEPSDSEWVRLRRLEEDRRTWLFGKIKSFGAWAVKGYKNHPYEIEARANEWPAKQG